MNEDPDWLRASQWLATGTPGKNSVDLAVVGFPLNQSLTPGSCDLAPAAIREALARYSTFDTDLEVDLKRLAVNDLGNLALAGVEVKRAAATLAAAVAHARCA